MTHAVGPVIKPHVPKCRPHLLRHTYTVAGVSPETTRNDRRRYKILLLELFVSLETTTRQYDTQTGAHFGTHLAVRPGARDTCTTYSALVIAQQTLDRA